MNKQEVLTAIKGTQFEKDLQVAMDVNGGNATRGMKVKLMAVGLKSRNMKITDVKKYYGVKGTAKDIAPILESYKVALMA